MDEDTPLSDEKSASDDMNSEHTTTEEPVESETSSEASTETTDTAEADGDPSRPVTPERVADVALGLGATAFEALDRAARSLDATVRRVVEDAPAVIADLEEKGRPVREKIVETLRGRPTVSDVFTSTDQESAPSRGGDDIATLEARVRELEQQVGDRPDAPADPSPFSMLEIDAPPAESGGVDAVADTAPVESADVVAPADAPEAQEASMSGDTTDAPASPEDGVG